jgi:SAM-dependent methyltransferase
MPRVADPTPFHLWQLSLINTTRIYSALDVGCGAGHLTQALRALMPSGALITALDVQRSAALATHNRLAVDAMMARMESLPVASGQYDLVTAGHVLPSATNIHTTISEMHRVLTEDGLLMASADSKTSGRLLLEWHAEACRRAGHTTQASRALSPAPRDQFTLENGRIQLARRFSNVEVHTRDTELRFPSVEALLDLYGQGLHLRGAPPTTNSEKISTLALELRPHMLDIAISHANHDGGIRIPRRSGCLIAEK